LNKRNAISEMVGGLSAQGDEFLEGKFEIVLQPKKIFFPKKLTLKFILLLEYSVLAGYTFAADLSISLAARALWKPNLKKSQNSLIKG
jgi:hypothetical protein